jgi:replicative DNA helicase
MGRDSRKPEFGSSKVGMVPPHNTEAEESVILNMVHSPEVIPDVLAVLNAPEDFYHDDYREIFAAVLAINSRGGKVDVIEVSEELERRGHPRIAKFGGPLERIFAGPSFSWHAVEHATYVRDKAILRGVMATCEAVIREGYANRMRADEVLAEAMAQLQGIASDHMGSGTVTVAEMIPKVLDRMERRRNGEIFGLPSGLGDIDSFTDGFQPQELILIGARSSMGKTSIALQICDHIATSWGKPSLFVSLEMNEFLLSERVLITRAKVDGHKVRTGQELTPDEDRKIRVAAAEIEAGSGPIHILVRPSRNIVQIANEVRAIKARRSVEFVVVDYVQIIDSDNPREGEVQALSKISAILKDLARTLNVPLIVISQLNRGLENREDKTPRMSDLRGSGALEQDADIILLLHRPEYFDATDRPGMAQLVIAKNRNGRTGSIDLVFRKELMRFEQLARHVTT